MWLLIILFNLESAGLDSLPLLGNIKIEGNSVFSEMEIHHILDINSVSKQEIEKGIERLLTRYQELGYPFVLIEPGDFNLLRDGISFTLRIDEGVKLYIEDVRVVGNSLTRENVIEREFRLKETQIFDPVMIDKARERLERLGFIEVGSIQPISLGDGSGNGYLLLDVKELASSSLEGLLGYSSGNITGFLEVDIDNLFGTGRRLDGRYSSYREERKTIFLHYTEPWLMGYPVDLSLEAENELYDTLMVNNVKAYFNVSPLFEYSLRFGAEWEKVTPGRSIWFGLIGGKIEKKSLLFSFYTRYGMDGIDRLSSWSELLAGRIFLRVNGEATFIDSIPLHQMVVVGGAGSVRGYDEEEVKGRKGIWGNLEYRIPIGGGSRVFPFFDCGYVEKIEGPILIMFSGGLGVSFRTGIGRWSVDYGVGRGRDIIQGRLHIRLKTTL